MSPSCVWVMDVGAALCKRHGNCGQDAERSWYSKGRRDSPDPQATQVLSQSINYTPLCLSTLAQRPTPGHSAMTTFQWRKYHQASFVVRNAFANAFFSRRNLPPSLQELWDRLGAVCRNPSMAGTMISWLSTSPDGGYVAMTKGGERKFPGCIGAIYIS